MTGVAGGGLAAGNCRGGGRKGAASSDEIELNLRVLEHTWGSRSPMEVTARLERDRRSPATMSSGNVKKLNADSDLRRRRARVSGDTE